MSLLAFESVTIERTPGIALVRDVRFEINPGERAALVGPNGCGKSTLLQVAAGFLAPAHGRVVERRGLRKLYLPQTPPRTDSQSVRDRALSCHPGYLRMKEETDPERFAHVLSDWIDQGGLWLEADAERVLRGLDFAPEEMDRATSTLSSGERMRVELARALLSGADLLLLDEPTNHLDRSALAWLVHELEHLSSAVLIVSHQRSVLDAATTRTLWIERGRLLDLAGPYSEARLRKQQAERTHWTEYEAIERRAAAAEAAAERRMALAAQVAKAPPGARHSHDFYRRKAGQIQRTARILRERCQQGPQVEKPWEEKPMAQLDFSSGARSGGPLLRVRSLGAAYPGKRLFCGLDLDIGSGSRIAVTGANGCGKTTLLRMLAGEMEPREGALERSPALKPGYLAQEAHSLPHGATPLELCLQYGGDETRARTLLGCLKLPAEAVQRSVEQLSAGERTKTGLALLLLSDANLLLLDEPTNHLEIEAQEALEEALSRYPGALVMVSHDEAFIDAVGAEKVELAYWLPSV